MTTDLPPCRECEFKSSKLEDTGYKKKRLYIICISYYLDEPHIIKNTGINPEWCPLRKRIPSK